MSDPREGEEVPELEDAELPVDGDAELPVDAPEGDEGDETPADGEAEPEAPKLTRRQQEIIKLRTRAREAELRAARAEGAASARGNQPDAAAAARQVQQEAEEQRLVDQMAPADRAQYLMAKELRNTQQQTQQIRQDIADSRDESKFLAKYGTDPRFAEYMDDVESRHAQMRAQGVPIQREAVLKFLIGERAMSAPAKKAAKVQRAAATERVAAARSGNTGAARSNVRGTPGKGGSLVSRMEAADAPI